jgi:hypothetical protein
VSNGAKLGPGSGQIRQVVSEDRIEIRQAVREGGDQL